MSERTQGGGVGLRARVYLLMAIGIFFPLAVMGTAGLYWLRELDERILSGRLASAGAVAAHVDEELTSDLELLQRLAASLSAGFGDADLSDERKAIRDAREHFRHREALFLLDKDRNVLAEEPPGRTSEVPRTAIPLVEEVLLNGRPRLSGVVLEERGPVVHELVPVRSWRDEVVGVVGGTFRPERRAFDRMLKHLRPGSTGFAEILDASGMVLASTKPGRVGRRSECAKTLGSLVGEKKQVSARCATCHVERHVDEPAAEFLTLSPVGAAPWGVVVRQEAAEALPSEGALPWYAVGGILFLQLALAGTFAWGAARSVTQPVAVLTSEAERIAGGELAWPIPDLGHDEVGRLGKSLERVRQNLGSLLEREAYANTQLEARVEDRTKELNEANARLREREEARAQLLRKVISAQEDERKRIARELHDETSQSLAVLAMGIEGAQDAIRSGRTPRLDEVKAVTVRTLEDVHRLILDLRPSVLDDLGLVSAIRWYAERHLEARGISVRCELGDVPRLPPEMETALFRVCQEAMSNVARHAQATAVLVEVGIEDGDIRISIEDDGRGFDPAAAARREGRRPWGLMGIRERAEILGGSARIDSAPGKGTRVELRVAVPDGVGGARGNAPEARPVREKVGKA